MKISQNSIRQYFWLSVFAKGLVSFAEVVAGVVVLVVPVSYFANSITWLVHNELLEDPGDFLATHLMAVAHQLSITGGLFIAVYLLSRGLIKLVLVIALLKNQLWAYPSSLVVIGLFVLYQLYQIISHHSLFVVALTIFDIIVMWLIWKEYTIVKSSPISS